MGVYAHLCDCIHATVHIWRSELNLRSQPSLSTMFETGSLVLGCIRTGFCVLSWFCYPVHGGRAGMTGVHCHIVSVSRVTQSGSVLSFLIFAHSE